MRFGRFLRHVGVSIALVIFVASLPAGSTAAIGRDYCFASNGVVTSQFGTAQCEADATSTATAFGPNSFASASNNSLAQALAPSSSAVASNDSTATARGASSTAIADGESLALVSGSDSSASAEHDGWAVVRGNGSEAIAIGCQIQVDDDGVTGSCP